jgi:hypothetical protein
MKTLTFKSIDENAIEEIIERNNPGTPMKIGVGKDSPHTSIGILHINKSMSHHDGYFQVNLDTRNSARDRTDEEINEFMGELENLSDKHGGDIKSGNCTEQTMRVDARDDGLLPALKLILDTAIKTNNHLN